MPLSLISTALQELVRQSKAEGPPKMDPHIHSSSSTVSGLYKPYKCPPSQAMAWTIIQTTSNYVPLHCVASCHVMSCHTAKAPPETLKAQKRQMKWNRCCERGSCSWLYLLHFLKPHSLVYLLVQDSFVKYCHEALHIGRLHRHNQLKSAVSHNSVHFLLPLFNPVLFFSTLFQVDRV